MFDVEKNKKNMVIDLLVCLVCTQWQVIMV